MQLHSLRPKQGADLHQLRALLDGRGWRSALPASMPDAVLLRLARDFRAVEEGLCGESSGNEEIPSFRPAVYVLMSLVSQHPSLAEVSGELPDSVEGMMQALQMYQWGLEREIVTRIVGVKSSDLTSALVAGLRRSLRG